MAAKQGAAPAAGNNRLDGKTGADTLTGGSGADTFVSGTGSGHDTITDFSSADGDMIDVSAYHGVSGSAIFVQYWTYTELQFGDGSVITILNGPGNQQDPNLFSHIVW